MRQSDEQAGSKITLEACVASVEGAIIAEQAGADRVELNVALELDGLSPSPGLLKLAADSIRIPIITMARPRGGDFVYTDQEWATLLADAKWQLENGATGIAFGCLNSDRQIDARRCDQMRKMAGQKELVFHKAFDELANWESGLDILIQSGINRVMTSGQQPKAVDGIETIAGIVDRSSGRIEVLPAGGVSSQNAVQILDRTGCTQIHGSFSSGTSGDIATEIKQTISAATSRH